MAEPTFFDLLDIDFAGSNVNPADTSYYDFGDGEVSYDPNNDYGNNSGQISWSSLADAIKRQFGGTGYGGQLGQLAAFGGLSALMNKMMTQKADPVGYQGGIPQYTVTRTQTPMAQQRPVSYESIPSKEGEAAPAVMRQIPYRPGQGGITYFKPIQYNYTGRDLAAPTLAAPPAGGIVGGETTGGTTGGTTGITTNNTTPQYATDSDRQVAVGGGASGGLAELIVQAAHGGKMQSYNMGGYSGGRYLRGPGDGVSDSIPAKFEQSGQPARLADGEFVIDARTVSEIGNGSSEAGARKLYAMMDRVHKARKTAKRGKPSGADKFLPK